MTPRLERGERISLAALCLFSLALFALPLGLVFLRGLSLGGRPSLAPLREALADQAVRRALWHSVETSGWSGLFALAIGTALALAVGLCDLRARGPLVFALVLPMMIPQHVTAIAWLQTLGPGSPILGALGLAPPVGSPNPLYSRAGIVALLTIQHAPMAFLVVLAALRRLPGGPIEAARVAGAAPGRLLWRIVLPAVAPALIAAYALTVVATLGNFGIPALLGIPARYITLPVLIWRRLSSFGPTMLGDVAVLSALIGAVAVVAVLAQMALQRRVAARLAGTPRAPVRFRLGRARGAVEGALLLYIAATLALPLAALLATSLVPTYGVALTPQSLTLANYAEVLFRQQATLRAFANSTLIAGAAALCLAGVALVLAPFLGRGRGEAGGPARRAAGAVAVLGEIGFAVPGIVISIAFILAFIRPLPLIHLPLYNTRWIIFLAYLAAFLSIALKPVAAAAAQLDRSLDAAGRIAGAGFARRLWRIGLPLLAPAAGSGAILVFLTAYNEVTVSALLWTTGTETIGTTIFNYEDGGYAVLAAAMAMLTVVASLVLMGLLTLVGRRAPPGAVPWRP